MSRIFIVYSLAIIVITASIYYAVGQNNPVSNEETTQNLEQNGEIDPPVKKTDSDNIFLTNDGDEDNDSDTFFKKNEWSEYVTDPKYNEHIARIQEGNIYSDDMVNINALGSIQGNLKYGNSYYTNSKYKQYDEDKPTSKVITSGFLPEQIIQLHMDGTIGDRITVYIDHDSREENNRYILNYKAISDDEVIREINVGEIDIKFNHSKYAVYDNTDAKGLGADFTIRKGNLLFKAFGSVARGETAVEYFRGNSSPGEIAILDYQYIRGTYYQLEPFLRYDGVTAPPEHGDAYKCVAMTSAPLDPVNYTLNPVNISPDRFEIYIDDQNPYNKNNAILLPMDGGYYTKMVSGSDYTINFTTGVIQFLRTIPENSRIFVVYKRNGGTLDPCALSSGPGIFSDRIFVFIKYGYSINEDTEPWQQIYTAEKDKNKDGKINLDVYEIRSVYSLGAKNIIAADFSLIFYEDDHIMQKDVISKLGKYRLDLVDGTISFYTRESYKALLPELNSSKIYNEIKITDAYLYSKYKMSSAYYSEARVFKLKHDNLIEDSVRIKVDELDLSPSLYSVDHESGFVSFANFDNPVISSDTRIEIKYEYIPFGAMAEKFIGGMRADYDINKSLRIGGSILLSRDGRMDVIPEVGQEGEQTLMLEGDASLKLNSNRIADLYNIFAERKKKSIPLEFSAYGEYAKSYTDTNTFGKALIDNMEKADEIISISLSEKDWQLSSMPPKYQQTDRYTQSERGLLKYYYYRSLNSLETLRGPGFTPHEISYDVKPGPYNIAMGHITDNNILEQDQQVSLVFDFDFTSGPVVTVVTKRLTDTAMDLSGMQYIEAWVKYDGGPGESVNLLMDIGTVDEDSDGCGRLHTEDVNGNGYIDSNPSTGYSEDRGYTFHDPTGTYIITQVGSGPSLNSSTLGDGVLNTEDLNGNGMLDIIDNVYTADLGPIVSTDGKWERKRFSINWSTLTAAQVLTLQQTTSIRLYFIQRTPGAGIKGSVKIDSLKIISAKWKNPELDDKPIDNSETISVTLVNSIDDEDYRKDSFLYNETGIYKSLYGSKSIDEIESVSETALQIEYDIKSTDGDYASIQRKFTKELDISFYKTMSIWLNAREIKGESTLGFIIGSSDNDCIEYKVKLDFPLIWKWKELKLKLSDDSPGDIIGEVPPTKNPPDLKRIKYIKVVVYRDANTDISGKFWLNQIYVSEPDKRQGDAYWYEFELKTLQPLFKTDAGVPILSDMNLRYINKGNSSQFNSINKTVSNIKESYNELFASANILPNWNVNINYINELSSTDSFNEEVIDIKRGDARRDYLMLNSIISSQGNNPYITVSYSIDRNENSHEATTFGDTSNTIGYIEDKMKIVHSPTVLYRQTFSDFLYGNLSLRTMLDMSFSHDKINRDSLIVDNIVLSTSVPLQESEKTQSSNIKFEMEYSNPLFFLRPRVNTSMSEIVQLKGSDKYNETGIVNDINGNFHLPYLGGDNSRLLERINGANITIGTKGFDYLSPEYSSDINYQENDFKDYIDDQPIDQGFNRYKNSMSNLLTGIKFPIHIGKIKLFENIKHFQINYNRSVYFDEKDVPFEGEGAGLFNEKYGVTNVLSHLSPSVYDLFNRYPGYYFKGRGNAGEGRDLVYKTLNDDQMTNGISISNEYNNSLRLMDGFTTDLSIDTGIVDISCFWNINQVCERRNIFGVPNQILIMDTGINFEFDLLKIFKFDFLKKDSSDDSTYYSSLINIGLNLADNMLITYNINEKKISPSCGIVFKWNRNSIGFKYDYEFRIRTNKEYISIDLEEDDRDYVYLMNMEGNNKFIERDYGHRFISTFETDVVWLYNIFSNLYQLTNIPLFSIEYRMEINRYDYYIIVSPEPYDLFMLTSKLTLDLHKNIQGGISGSLAIENFRNRVDDDINRQVFSYEIGGSISFIF
ncbi:MAG: hypothetical protein FWH53_03860 [Leptospirales bacterium]|nr:hypothetical protein [Leptospirales bacterium]